MSKVIPTGKTHQFATSAHTETEQKLVDIIGGTVQTELIGLLGHTSIATVQESIFMTGDRVDVTPSHYYLLVLISDKQGKPLHEWQDKMEAVCKQAVPVTIIVIEVATFTEWLKEGHPFAGKVYFSARLLCGSREGLPVPQPFCRGKDVLESYYNSAAGRTREFLTGAGLYHLRHQPQMAAFMLHQATEQALQALLKTGTGYHQHTHNVTRLARLCGLVEPGIASVLNTKTEKEKRLLALLQKAYADTRYKQDYKINTHDLQCLMEKVKQIQRLLIKSGGNILKAP